MEKISFSLSYQDTAIIIETLRDHAKELKKQFNFEEQGLEGLQKCVMSEYLQDLANGLVTQFQEQLNKQEDIPTC